MISLLFMILIGWLLLRWMIRTTPPIHIGTTPQIVIHIHNANVLVQPHVTPRSNSPVPR